MILNIYELKLVIFQFFTISYRKKLSETLYKTKKLTNKNKLIDVYK